jgi:hypothetical protein
MRKSTLVLLLAACVLVGVTWHFGHHTAKPHRASCRAGNPCYIISMVGQPSLLAHSYGHYNGDCIDFTSLPDGQFHGYCGEFKIAPVSYN